MATEFQFGVSEDRKSATLKVGKGATQRVTPAEIDGMIDHLMRVRAGLLPEVPRSVQGAQNQMLGRLDWWVFDTRINGDRSLCVRHPGFGWMTFGFSDADATKLAELMTAPMVEPTASGGTA